ncbi:DUF669 domain-containing protein [Candidatus Sumerlaeota bacterium]|nr:DUF669 domain-containing protein [Candidatus Sumerlaeota bacterium]
MEEREYGWDETIENPDEGDFVIFPEGVYPFVVKHFERGRHTGSDKLPPCNMATVHIEFDGGQLGTTTVKHKLFLHSKTTGLLAQFFRGIGLRKKGDPLKFNWNAVPGCRGFAKLGVRKYKGNDFQDIKSFVDPENQPAETPAAWQQSSRQQTQAPAEDALPF